MFEAYSNKGRSKIKVCRISVVETSLLNKAFLNVIILSVNNFYIPDWILKNKQRIKHILARFSKKKILVVGDLMLDQFIWGDVSRISPEAPVPVVWVKRESYMPGGACNVAHNLFDLGAYVYLVGIIGQDSSGEILLQELKRIGIETSGIFKLDTRPTTHKTRVIAHSQQVVRIDREEVDGFPESMIEKIVDYVSSKIREVNAVIIEDYGKGLITSGLVKKLIELGRRYKKIITVDPKKEHFRYYKGVTTITPNKSETESAVGVEIKDDVSLKRAGERLLEKLKTKSILVTLGEKGMCLFEKDKKPIHIPTMARQVYDVSGAGDTVVASFTLALVSGASFPQAAYIANQCAGIVVGKIGTATATREELWQEIKKWK